MKGDREEWGVWGMEKEKKTRKCVYIFGNLTASHKLCVATFVKEKMGAKKQALFVAP